jgi:hypothetical protein
MGRVVCSARPGQVEVDEREVDKIISRTYESDEKDTEQRPTPAFSLFEHDVDLFRDDKQVLKYLRGQR